MKFETYIFILSDINFVIVVNLQSGRFQYRSMLHALTSIYKTEGKRGLYSGLVATVLRDAPFSGLYLMFYTEAKKLARSGKHQVLVMLK